MPTPRRARAAGPGASQGTRTSSQPCLLLVALGILLAVPWLAGPWLAGPWLAGPWLAGEPSRAPGKAWGESTPGAELRIFAPGIVSEPDRHELGSALSAEGREVFFGVDTGGRHEIWTRRFENGEWGPESRLLGHEEHGFFDPALDPDEERPYFISHRPRRQGAPAGDRDLWYVERRGDDEQRLPVETVDTGLDG